MPVPSSEVEYPARKIRKFLSPASNRSRRPHRPRPSARPCPSARPPAPTGPPHLALGRRFPLETGFTAGEVFTVGPGLLRYSIGLVFASGMPSIKRSPLVRRQKADPKFLCLGSIFL